VTEEPVEALRASATRGDYWSMMRLAHALYAEGLEPREVLRQCYEVDFPEEFWVALPERVRTPHLLAQFTNQPWDLAVPPGEGGADLYPLEHYEEIERALFAREPDLIPLMHLMAPRTRLVDTALCYRLTGLRSGDTAIFGVRMVLNWDPVLDPEPDPEPAIVHCGESLLSVLRQHHAEYLRDHEQDYDDPENWNYTLVSKKSLAELRSLVERIEAMQREVASRKHSEGGPP
jgi:hypothetical protein